MEIGDTFIFKKERSAITGFEDSKYGPVVVLKRSDGVAWKQFPHIVEKYIDIFNKPKPLKDRKKYCELHKEDINFRSLIKHLAQHGKIGGFQCIKSKEEQLKADYFNTTGEELKDSQYNSDLSKDTWGNAMRIYFSQPKEWTIKEINDILPGDVKAKRWSEDNSKLVISRMPFILDLLSIGFRHGINHKIEKIKKSIGE